MSKILKKITKKYKWLRFLNYKTTKLAVLSVALFGLCLSSGHSFAKYRDENYGGGNAGTAKFSNGIISYNTKTYSVSDVNEANNNFGTYAFVADFSLDFSDIETAADYILKIQFGETFTSAWKETPVDIEGVSFVWNKNNTLRTLVENNGAYKASTEIESNLGVNVAKNTGYAAQKVGTEYKWGTNDWFSYTPNQIEISGSISLSSNTFIYEYKLIYFVDIELKGSKVFAPDNYLLFNLDVAQKEVAN